MNLEQGTHSEQEHEHRIQKTEPRTTRMALLYAARNEIEQLAELIEILDKG